MKTEEEFTVFNPTGTVLCCGRNLSLSDFIQREGNSFFDPVKKATVKTFYYHCPNCDEVLVYNRGYDNSLQLVKGEVLPD